MSVMCAPKDLRDLPESVSEAIVSGRPQHIPEGWVEQPGGIHHGKGLWTVRVKRSEAP